MNNRDLDEENPSRLTPRQIRRGLSKKKAAYGEHNNGRTGYRSRTTANRLSTTNMTAEELERRKAAEKKMHKLNARRERMKSSLDRKYAPIDEAIEEETMEIPEANCDIIFDCVVLGPSAEIVDGELVEYYDLEEDYPELYAELYGLDK